jgi:hypothetical protein
MFFETDRTHFFRPLTGKYRELYVACLRSLYERLHGSSADYSQTLTKDALRDLLSPIIQNHSSEVALDSDLDQDEALDGSDLTQQVWTIVNTLTKSGWLEKFADRAGLVTARRFTRAGKLFSEALWSLDKMRTRSRQRNVRSCRNALSAALRNRDAYDLVDAYDYAEKVISDLSEGVDYFQELVRRLMTEANQTPWDEFLEFLDKFETDFKKQLTADNVERHRQAIREVVNQLRGIEDPSYRAIEAQLADVASWAAKERSGDSSFLWLLDRIEDMVEVACTNKNPELIKAMTVYMRRAASIVQQALMLRSGQTRHSFSLAISKVADLQGDEQSKYLEHLGKSMASAQIRLLDPYSFRLRSPSQRRKALTVTAKPKVTREARLEAALHRAEAGAFAISNDDVMYTLRSELRLRAKPFRLSSLSLGTASDVLQAMQAVEAVRNSRDPSVRATKLPSKLCTPYYTGSDYQIEKLHESD